MICVLHDVLSVQNFEMKQHVDIINSNLTALIKSYDTIRLLCKAKY